MTFRQAVTIALSSALAPPVRAAFLAKTARQVRDNLIATGQATETFATFVDGNEGASEDTVKPEGVIVYNFSYMSGVVAFALKWLQDEAPVLSGAYRDSFYVAVDGKFIPARNFVASSVPGSAEVIIGNTQPYNRKIDVQMLGYLNIASFYSVQPNIYARCCDAIQARFGNAVTTRRVYNVNFPGKYILRTGRDAKTPVQSPALVITPRGL